MKMNKNVEKSTVVTHEGAPAKRISTMNELRRSVLSCMLWEDTFYESGEDIADRIVKLVSAEKDADALGKLAIAARSEYNLRHAPLLVVRAMLKNEAARTSVGSILPQVIQRPDELAEFLAIYWKNGRTPLAKQVKVGLAKAFEKFNEYSLAKYNQDRAVKLKDVAFLVHPKVAGESQPKVENALNKKQYKRGKVLRHDDSLVTKLVKDELATPDTWEVALSTCKTPEEKKAVWERLLAEKKLGAMAVLRNLRNMTQVNVDTKLIREYMLTMKTDRVLPFRFISAARYAPQFEDTLEKVMLKNLEGSDKLPGKTKLLVDVSGSMSSGMSGKSDLNRCDAAAALAILLREICEEVEIIAFGTSQRVCKPRRGFALRDEIGHPSGGTMLGEAVKFANKTPYDRIIVITDEQSADPVGAPKGRGYMINVASYKNGVGYGPWTHIDGFSESIVKFIQMYEKEGY